MQSFRNRYDRLEEPKLEDLTVIEAPKHDMSKKVRCTFRRAMTGTNTPRQINARLLNYQKNYTMSYFLKEFNTEADSIITNAVVLDATNVVAQMGWFYLSL